MVQLVKNSAAMQETQVKSLGEEEPLEKEMSSHSSIFAWTIRRTKEHGGLQSMGMQRVGHDLASKHTNLMIDHILFKILCTNLLDKCIILFLKMKTQV